MISFKKIADTKETPERIADNRFEQIRQKAAEKHRKSDADRARRAAPLTVEDDRTS